jgi:hypothetical protein
MNVVNKIVGTWKLVHSLANDKEGNVTYPFGRDAVGYIIYSECGRMSVQICRKQRSPFSNDKLKKATAEDAMALTQDYLAYFGRYEIDEEKRIVSHSLEGALCPNFVGSTLQRQFEFYDNKMSLRPYNDGTDREILWEKLSS